MILPTKTIPPVDSLISIAASVLDLLTRKSMGIDDLVLELNEHYYKKITLDKVILTVDFLYITGKIEEHNEVIKVII